MNRLSAPVCLNMLEHPQLVDRSVPSLRSALQIRPVWLRSVSIPALAPVVTRLFAVSSIIVPFAHVVPVLREMRSIAVCPYLVSATLDPPSLSVH